MKVLALITWTDCENKYRSLQAIGHEVVVEEYDNRPHDRHIELVDLARQVKPDAILYIGAVEQYHNRPVPKPEIFCRLREVAPTIHMCNDAGDPPWWPTLEEYHQHDCFDVQVSIDGARETPLASWPEGMLALTPIDHRVFNPRPWRERHTRLGMMGGHGNGERRQILDYLLSRHVITFHEGTAHLRPYEEMANFLCDTKIAFSHPATGSHQKNHVKGRVVEAGFAGCVLLDHEDAPTRDWFTPNTHYLTYRDVHDIERIVRDTPDEFLAEIAMRFFMLVTTEHHPAVFWSKVFERAKVNEHR